MKIPFSKKQNLTPNPTAIRISHNKGGMGASGGYGLISIENLETGELVNVPPAQEVYFDIVPLRVTYKILGYRQGDAKTIYSLEYPSLSNRKSIALYMATNGANEIGERVAVFNGAYEQALNYCAQHRFPVRVVKNIYGLYLGKIACLSLTGKDQAAFIDFSKANPDAESFTFYQEDRADEKGHYVLSFSPCQLKFDDFVDHVEVLKFKEYLKAIGELKED